MKFDIEVKQTSLAKRTIDDTITEIAITGLILMGIKEVISVFSNAGTIGGVAGIIYLIAIIGKNYLGNKYN